MLRRRTGVTLTGAMLASALLVSLVVTSANATSPLGGDDDDEPALHLQGRWRLDDSFAQGRLVADATGRADGVAGRAVEAGRAPVAPYPETQSFYFPGWTDADDGTVHPNESAVVIPHREEFNPGSKRFKVTVWVRPNSLSGSGIPNGESPNIVQKGMFSVGGHEHHQWKISMHRDMRPSCVFRGDWTNPATGRQEVQTRFVAPPPGDPAGVMRAGEAQRIACSLSDGQVTLTIRRVGPDGFEHSSWSPPQPAGVFTVHNDDAVWLGKKPHTREAGDSYAGHIDNVVIWRE